MKYPIITDRGGSYHIKERDFFDTISPDQGTVHLREGKTSIAIKGVGTVKCFIGSNLVTLENVRYIPELGESIYSLFLHVQSPGHGLIPSFDDGIYITFLFPFPTFKTKAIIGSHDIYLDSVPVYL
jgi:hypothetical protein